MTHLFSPGRVLFKCIVSRLDAKQRERAHKVVKGVARPRLWEYTEYDRYGVGVIGNFRSIDVDGSPFGNADPFCVYFNSLKRARAAIPDKIDEWQWVRGKNVRRRLKKGGIKSSTIRRHVFGDFLVLCEFDEARGDDRIITIRVSRKDEKAVRKILNASERRQLIQSKKAIAAIRDNCFIP